MKAARRQDLKTNELAHGIQELRGYLGTHGNRILIGAALVAVLIVAVTFMRRSQREAVTGAYNQLEALPTITDEDVTRSFAEATRLSNQTEDDAFVADALRMQIQMAMNRAHAPETGKPNAEFLDLAQQACESVIQRLPDRTLDVGLALSTLATIEEDRFVLDGDTSHKEKARALLERIRDNSALNGTPIQSLALERLNRLDETFVQVQLADAPPPAAPQFTTETLTPIDPSEVPSALLENADADMADPDMAEDGDEPWPDDDASDDGVDSTDDEPIESQAPNDDTLDNDTPDDPN